MVLVVLFVFVLFILDGRYDFAARRVDFHFHDLLVLDYFHIERRLILVMLVLGMDSLASNVLLGGGYRLRHTNLRVFDGRGIALCGFVRVGTADDGRIKHGSSCQIEFAFHNDYSFNWRGYSRGYKATAG